VEGLAVNAGEQIEIGKDTASDAAEGGDGSRIGRHDR
jgi:hypothetical protein